VKGSPLTIGFASGFPLAEDGRKPIGIEQGSGGGVAYFELIFAEVERVDELPFRAGPDPVGNDTVKGKMLLFRGTRMEIIQAHGFVEEKVIEVDSGRRIEQGEEQQRQHTISPK